MNGLLNESILAFIGNVYQKLQLSDYIITFLTESLLSPAFETATYSRFSSFYKKRRYLFPAIYSDRHLFRRHLFLSPFIPSSFISRDLFRGYLFLAI